MKAKAHQQKCSREALTVCKLYIVSIKIVQANVFIIIFFFSLQIMQIVGNLLEKVLKKKNDLIYITYMS